MKIQKTIEITIEKTNLSFVGGFQQIWFQNFF